MNNNKIIIKVRSASQNPGITLYLQITDSDLVHNLKRTKIFHFHIIVAFKGLINVPQGIQYAPIFLLLIYISSGIMVFEFATRKIVKYAIK